MPDTTATLAFTPPGTTGVERRVTAAIRRGDGAGPVRKRTLAGLARLARSATPWRYATPWDMSRPFGCKWLVVVPWGAARRAYLAAAAREGRIRSYYDELAERMGK